LFNFHLLAIFPIQFFLSSITLSRIHPNRERRDVHGFSLSKKRYAMDSFRRISTHKKKIIFEIKYLCRSSLLLIDVVDEFSIPLIFLKEFSSRVHFTFWGWGGAKNSPLKMITGENTKIPSAHNQQSSSVLRCE
jgi:hypothetical protein